MMFEPEMMRYGSAWHWVGFVLFAASTLYPFSRILNRRLAPSCL